MGEPLSRFNCHFLGCRQIVRRLRSADNKLRKAKRNLDFSWKSCRLPSSAAAAVSSCKENGGESIHEYLAKEQEQAFLAYTGIRINYIKKETNK